MRRQFWKSMIFAGGLLAVAALAGPARAQDSDDLKRGVARISVMNGDVNVRRGDSGEWVAGVINAPLLSDDRIATGPSSRAEIQFDASNVLRLGANAEVHLAQLEYARYQMEIGRGLATFRMLRPTDVNIEIDTPSVSVRPSRQGSVRIAVTEAGETEVTARGGDVEVFTPHGSQWIRSGQSMLARGSASDPEFQIVAAGAPDDWDRWCDSRDRTLTHSNSYQYVGPGVYGAEDLDNYGTWESVPEYGNVWRPTVAADWSPYYYGRWSWADWYGWTWVSYDPWGWAPYHYGRWFHHDRFGWCWYPGVHTARHYWSPGLVAFIGFGGGGGVGFGFGNVGWVPLAPYEVYHPWWGRHWYGSGGYLNHQVNITNVNVYNSYRNARYNGISAVGYQDFSNGRFNRVSRFNGTQIHEAGAIRGATPFSPGTQHMRYSDRAVTNVPRVNENARFFRSQTPTPVQHMSVRGTEGRGTPGIGNVNAAPQGGGQQNGWRRFGQTDAGGSPAGQSRVDRGGFGTGQQPQDRRLVPNDSPGRGSSWQRFGNPGGNQQARAGQSRVDRGGFGSGQQPAGQQPQDRRSVQNESPKVDNRGSGWQRFGNPGGSQQAAPRSNDGGGRTFGNTPRNDARQQPAPRQDFSSQPRGSSGGREFGNGGGGRQESIRVAPPVVRERPSYSAPQRQSAPSYSAPRQSAPSGGGGNSHGNSGGGGGGGSRQSGGGGNHRGR